MTVLNENKLSEITDRTVIARISALIQASAQTATQAMANNAQNALKGLELVKPDIPFFKLTKSKDLVGAASKLTKSKDLSGAARGYVHEGRVAAKI
jgi:hypothetical protein